MKKAILLMALFAAGSFYVANAATIVSPIALNNSASVNATPPAAVLQSFASLFGNVAVRQWKQRSNGQWRAHFVKNGRAWEATFTGTGALVKSEPA